MNTLEKQIDKKKDELIEFYELLFDGDTSQHIYEAKIKKELSALKAQAEQESNHDPLCYHECPECNTRCNCNSQPCSHCSQSDQEKTTKTKSKNPECQLNLLEFNCGYNNPCVDCPNYVPYVKR